MRSRLTRLVLAAALLATGAAPAAAYWLCEDWIGFQAEPHSFRFRLLDFAA